MTRAQVDRPTEAETTRKRVSALQRASGKVAHPKAQPNYLELAEAQMAAARSVHARVLMLEQRAGQASILDCEHTEGLVEDTIGRSRMQIRTSRAPNLFQLSPAVDIRRLRW